MRSEKPRIGNTPTPSRTLPLQRERDLPPGPWSIALPVWIVVKKHREVFMLGNVRIHLDRVEGLGAFLEFEALVSRDHPEAGCHEALADLRAGLGPVLGEPIACGYSDLVAAEQEQT